MGHYENLKNSFIKGWNTWNTRSVLSYVYLPYGFAVNLAFADRTTGSYLKEALIGRFGEDDEKIHPGFHAYDGSYAELNLKWKNMEFIIQNATYNDDLIVLVTPLVKNRYPATLVVESGILWNRKGCVVFEGDIITCKLENKNISVYITEDTVFEPNVATQTPYYAIKAENPVGISTGKSRSLSEIIEIINNKKLEHCSYKQKYGDVEEIYNAMQSCIAWDTIYEPKKDRVITTVSRLWNVSNLGYVLFCWDTYFAAYMTLLDNKELAYSNAIEITKEKTKDGFVPNTACAMGFKTLDRSEPPVGSITVRELYRKYGDKWILEELYDDLYKWNDWFLKKREVKDGLMAWGSNPYDPIYGNYWEETGVGCIYGSALESGLDNSPMYDNIPFNKEKNVMELADVGLTSLYIMDCHALSDIAAILCKNKESDMLRARADKFSKGLMTLWDEEVGMFLNRRTDTGEYSYRMSPTNFYPLICGVATQEQAERIIKEHFYNPEEFWGEWILPSIARNDSAYPDQNYWRGRIWAPMNFLVYLGLRRYDLPQARRDLVEKSRNLLLKEWLESGHVHENYSGDTGEGCDKHNSDKFYHWGALLSLIVLMEEGYIEGPEKPL